ncbi:NUDIX hydrolase [Flagellimonas beolgyonensis]|jgi:ADP-ribose pyrophosphatase YjhB (NUDIX family)|uniref:NUDIX hydrolase n=1 Tax=Flagellimonas beolgyonensis TaxID=864064 RepID=UPI000F8EFABA|nr:NUDIX domain-containing protein [Allomuricauda beolgyonensis]
MDFKEFLEKGKDLFLPNLSVDMVIIGYENNELKCLLLQIGDKWLLPGGFIFRTESVEEATLRILSERTGLVDPHFKFLAVFGNSNRKFTEEWKPFFKEQGVSWGEDAWFNDRFVTLSYYSLVDIDKTKPVLSDMDTGFAWFKMDALPEMWMDHRDIVHAAKNRLREDVQQEHLTYNLLPEEFTMPQLHQLHQTILGEELDRSRFQKKMLSLDIFERLPKLKKDTPGRNPYRYRIKRA